MKNTKKVGDISEAKIIASLMAKGQTVLLPFSDNERYDLVLDNNGNFYRVQCKTGRLINGSIRAAFKSVSSNGKNVRGYHGQVEYFAIYCPETDKSYLLSAQDVNMSIYLRVAALNRGCNPMKVRWAKDFEI